MIDTILDRIYSFFIWLREFADKHEDDASDRIRARKQGLTLTQWLRAERDAANREVTKYRMKAWELEKQLSELQANPNEQDEEALRLANGQ